MARRRGAGRRVAVDALVGAASGLAASWIMERAQAGLGRLEGERARRREAEAQGDRPPATVATAERLARLAHRPLPEARRALAGEVVHYVTGAGFGALFGALAPRLPGSALAAGALFGAAVWALNDEALVPALGLAPGPRSYPAVTHAKALAAHLVYGTATGAGVRLLGAALP